MRTDFVEVSTLKDFKVVNEGDEVRVELHYKCWIDDTAALFPMDVSTSVTVHDSLQDCIKQNLEEYKKTYSKVEIKKVFVNYKQFSDTETKSI